MNKLMQIKILKIGIIVVTLIIALLGAYYFIVILPKKDNPSVKKSTTGICHKEGTLFYNNIKNFTAYDSIDKCLNSGGRLPKN